MTRKTYWHPVDEAAKMAAQDLKDKFWANRLRDMMQHVAHVGSGRFTDLEFVTPVPAGWPVHGGAIGVRRKADKATFSLGMKGGKFTITRMPWK